MEIALSIMLGAWVTVAGVLSLLYYIKDNNTNDEEEEK